MTLEDVVCDWQGAVRMKDRQGRIEQAEKWNEYYSYLAKKQRNAEYRPDPAAEKLVRLMLQENILQKADRVLDVGAGMGSYTIEIAKHSGQVTAADMNEDCLSVLERRAEQAGVGHIKCVPAMWENMNLETRQKKYDLCFSSMCPAICSVQDLESLEKMSRRTVCLVSVMQGSYEKHRREMMRQLEIKPKGMTTEAIYYYNALYLMGRRPNVKCWSSFFRYPMSSAEIMERFPIYFKIFGLEEERTLSFLEGYLREHAEDGVLLEECRMNMAMIYWNTVEDGKE